MWTKLGSLRLSDWWRGLIVAVATSPLTIILESLKNGVLTFDFQNIGIVALTGGLAYLLKNMVTGQQGNILTNK